MVDQYGRWYPDYPGQQPFQDPQYMRAIGQPVHQQQGQQYQQQPTQMSGANQQQDMTPTIRAEIKQVESIAAIDRIPQAAGTTDAYMTKDEAHIVFRTMYANGEHTDKIYDERPPAPPAPKFDPNDYVRKDQLEPLLRDILTPQQPQKKEGA